MGGVVLPPRIEVWRSVRRQGDTKTKRSRRTIALPARCVDALLAHRSDQDRHQAVAGEAWHEHGLVFSSQVGTPMDASNVRRAFRAALDAVPGIDSTQWTPRELRHSFVSLLSDQGVPVEEIARLVGHSSTSVTETVYRHQIRPVMETASSAMDEIFGTLDADDDQDQAVGSHSVCHSAGVRPGGAATNPSVSASGWGDSKSRPLDPQENSRRPSPSDSVQIALVPYGKPAFLVQPIRPSPADHSFSAYILHT